MLNPREMAVHAALCSERGRCILLLAACAGVAVGFAALTFIFKHTGCFHVLAGIAVVDVVVAVNALWRLSRLTQRIENLERFL